MFKPFGVSVYVSSFEKQKPMLEKLKDRQVPVFTSLHIHEEVNKSYVEDVEEMCRWLNKHQFYIIADVSPYSLEHFGENSLSSLVKRLHLKNVRLDFGFDEDDIKDIKDIDKTYNASTIEMSKQIEKNSFYMHNFYPRPETGLSDSQLSNLNNKITQANAHTLGFITGDKIKRGPIFEGLPTLEAHRNMAPYTQYVDLMKRHKMDSAFVGDILLSNNQLELITAYIEDKVIKLPVVMELEQSHILNEVLTVRTDSPDGLIRVQESREYAQQGKAISPVNTVERIRGTVTMDNERYKRYSGEVQIMREHYPADDRVNVIGHIPDAYLLLLDNLKNGDSFMFVPVQD